MIAGHVGSDIEGHKHYHDGEDGHQIVDEIPHKRSAPVGHGGDAADKLDVFGAECPFLDEEECEAADEEGHTEDDVGSHQETLQVLVQQVARLKHQRKIMTSSNPFYSISLD